MSRQLTESKVLKKLGIPDFRHLTKSKVIQFASLIDRVDPEVAMKAIEQFPEFANTSKEILAEFKESIDKGFESNDESMKSFYETNNLIIMSLQKELDKDNLTFDEKKYIIDKMLEVSNAVYQKDSENKKFIVTLAVVAGGIATVAIAALAATLGGNTRIEDNSEDYDEEDDY
jgi:hypothetical protein